jgi:hypothetical protein
MNGDAVEIFHCAECHESCKQVHVHVTGRIGRFCCLGQAREKGVN